MDMLNNVLGGQRQQYEDFVQRYDQGAPWDGIRDDEALERYREVAPNLSEQDYRESAEPAFARLTPEQRTEFGRWLQQQSRQGGAAVEVPGGNYDDPSALAGAAARAHQEQPGLLEGLLRGAMGSGAATQAGGNNLLSNPIAKGVLSGIAATAASKVMGRR